MRGILVLSLVGLCACASSGGSTARPSEETVKVEGVGNFKLTSNTQTSESQVQAPVDVVWRIMPAVFDSVGIPITTVDAATHTIANTGFKVRRYLGKTPLSRYLDCGNSQVGPNADSYEVVLQVQTQVRSGDAGSTTIASTVDAMAKPINFAQEYSRCSSSGGIERRIAEVAKAQLQR